MLKATLGVMRLAAAATVLGSTALAAGNPEALSLNKCQKTLRKQVAAYMAHKEAAIGACLDAVSTAIIANQGASAASAANTCVTQFRKLNDTRALGKSLPEKLLAGIDKKCLPGAPNVLHTSADLTGVGSSLSQPLDAANLAGWCTNFGGGGTISVLADWTACIGTAAECAVDAAISVQYPRALEWLGDVRPAMLALTPPANDSTKVSDAVAGLDAVKASIGGAGNTNIPNMQCGRTCAAGQTACATGCSDLQSDTQNCGTCGTVCPIGQSCSAGICSSCTGLGTSCVTNVQCCSGLCSGGVCTACSANGASCVSNVQCCSGTCSNGACCGSTGQSCVTNVECCSGTCSGGSCAP